jgi:hypothetical protein
MAASEDFTSVTDPFRAELPAHRHRMAGPARHRMAGPDGGAGDRDGGAGDRDGVYGARAPQVLTVTSGSVARVVSFLDPGLPGWPRLPPVHQPATTAGAVVAGADRSGRRGVC